MDERKVAAALASERIRLENVRRAIEGKESQIESPPLGEMPIADQHPADVGTETFERTKDIGILESVLAEIADVEHALRRLEIGSYGTCEACGRPIPRERLDALPAARFCVEDQARAERDARVAGGL